MRKSNLATVTRITTGTTSRAEAIVNTTPEIWGRRTAIIPIDLFDIDYSYQRVRTAHVNELYDNWDNNSCEYILASYRDDKFYIIDGQHRYYAALAKGLKDLPCIIRTDLTMQDEAMIFVKMNSSRKPLKPYDTYKANIANGNEDIPEVKVDMGVKRVCDKYNVTVCTDNSRCDARKLRALTSVRRIVESYGESGLEWIFETMKETSWYDCGEAYVDNVLSALKAFYTDNISDLDNARKKLIKIMKEYSPMDLILYANKKYPEYGRYARLSSTLRELS